MRRPLFVVLAMLLLGRMAAADPCTPARGHGDLTDEQLFAKASAVVIARIYRVEEVKVERATETSPPITTVEATLRVEEVLKGAPPADGKVGAAVVLGCGMTLLAGLDHLLFLGSGNIVEDGNLPGSNVGARWILKRSDGKVVYAPRGQLEKLRELAKKEQK